MLDNHIYYKTFFALEGNTVNAIDSMDEDGSEELGDHLADSGTDDDEDNEDLEDSDDD